MARKLLLFRRHTTARHRRAPAGGPNATKAGIADAARTPSLNCAFAVQHDQDADAAGAAAALQGGNDADGYAATSQACTRISVAVRKTCETGSCTGKPVPKVCLHMRLAKGSPCHVVTSHAYSCPCTQAAAPVDVAHYEKLARQVMPLSLLSQPENAISSPRCTQHCDNN